MFFKNLFACGLTIKFFKTQATMPRNRPLVCEVQRLLMLPSRVQKGPAHRAAALFPDINYLYCQTGF